MAERMGRFLDALHSANQPKVKVGDKVKAVKGGDFSGTVEKVKKDGSVSFRHSDGKLYRTHHTNVRVMKEDTDSEGDTMQMDEESWRHEGEWKEKEDVKKDEYGNVIKPENRAKNLAKKALARKLAEKVKPVDEGLLSGTLKVAGKVFNAPAYSWAGEKLEKREKAKKLAAERAARKARRTTKKAQTKEVSESAEQNDRVKKVMDKYRGIRNKVNTKPELEVSIRNTSPNIMGNIPGHEGPKPNANF